MIKLRHGVITGRDGRLVLRGELDTDTIFQLLTDWYQRGEVASFKTKRLVKSLEAGAMFPDLTLGMRGKNYQATNSGEVSLSDPVYVIDGMQRWSAALYVLENMPDIPVQLGARVFAPTDVEFERNLFREMNQNHTAMGASVLLRNEKETSRVAATLYGLSINEPDFALCHRVAWNQQAATGPGGDLVRGIVLLKVLASLQMHLMRGAKGASLSRVLDLLSLCDNRIDAVGLNQSRKNLVRFFDVIDEVWGIRSVPIKFGAPQLKEAWLVIIARIFSDHREFWRDEIELFVSKDHIRDLRKIDPNDPALLAFASAGGAAAQRQQLYFNMLAYLNKGKRGDNRLVNRYDIEKMEAEAEKYSYTHGHHASSDARTQDNERTP